MPRYLVDIPTLQDDETPEEVAEHIQYVLNEDYDYDATVTLDADFNANHPDSRP